MRGARGQFWKHLEETGEADTMANLPPRSSLDVVSADDPLTPGAHNPVIALAGQGLACLCDERFDTGDERTRITDQLATAMDLDTTNRTRWWGRQTVKTSCEIALAYRLKHTWKCTVRAYTWEGGRVRAKQWSDIGCYAAGDCQRYLAVRGRSPCRVPWRPGCRRDASRVQRGVCCRSCASREGEHRPRPLVAVLLLTMPNII